ncbi:sigma-70 family RNA polymerase sigma factor [soil metagenome]
MVCLSSCSAFPAQLAPSSVPESHDAITKVERDVADKAILLRCAAGSEAAFQELYARLAPVLVAMIFEILRHQKDAEDVLQEVFVQLWKKAGAYDPARGTVFTWAVTIARHKAIDRFRASHRRHTLLENAAAENAIITPEAVAPADDILMQRDEGKRVRAALRKIPAAQSAAIQLAFFGGLTQSEIAQKQGAPLGTIKARIRRGLFALRDSLANNPGRAHSSPARGAGLVGSPSLAA